MPMSRYQHSGGAQPAELDTPMTITTPSTIDISLTTGWPDGSVGPFFIVIDRGTANEEKILVQARTGTTLTIAQRGADDTPAADHSVGAVVEHVFTAVEADELNDHVVSATNVHGLAGGDPVIGQSHLTAHAALEDGVHGAPEGDPLVTTSELEQAVNATYQIGEVRMFATLTVPAKWIPCDGGEWPQADYPDLYAAIGDSFGAASADNFRVPDLMGRVPRGDYDPGTGGGSDSVSIGSSNMPAHTHSSPSHTHSINHDHPSATTGTDGSHDHVLQTRNDETMGQNTNRVVAAGGIDGVYDGRGFIQHDGSHNHSFNVPSYSGTSGSAGGTTGSAGSGTPLDVTPAHTLLLFAIYAGVDPAGDEAGLL